MPAFTHLKEWTENTVLPYLKTENVSESRCKFVQNLVKVNIKRYW